MKILQILLIFPIVLRVRCGILDLQLIVDKSKGFLPGISVNRKEPDFFPNFNINIEDAFLRPDQMLTKYRYPNDRQQIRTVDGYILSVYRVGHSNDTGNASHKPPVLLLHDVGTTAADFLMLGPGNALGYLLADAGYDVWILTNRGPKESGGHVSYKSAGILMSSKYWEFSFHEIGVYDLSATIDHILAVTNRQSLSVVAHSEGVTAVIVLLSEKPEYNKKINVHVGYAPPLSMCSFRQPLLRLAALPEYLHIYSMFLGIMGAFDLSPYMPSVKRILVALCSPGVITQPFCLELFRFIFGYNEVVPEALAIYMGHNPAESSTNQYTHYSQLIHNCKFTKYKKWIWEPTVPYTLSNVNCSTYIFSGFNDHLVSSADSVKSVNWISKSVKDHKIVPNFSHEDFVIGKFAKQKVYQPTIEILNSANMLRHQQQQEPERGYF